MEGLARLLADQSGVVSRAQALALGLAPHDVRRLVRRRDLSPVHPGVWVDHTGPLSWHQRAWAAVLVCSARSCEPYGAELGAALAGSAAMRAADGPGRGDDPAPITVAVVRDRRVVPPAGIRVIRTSRLDERVQWTAGPPRMRYEEAALDVAIESSTELGAIDVVARAVQGRRTTAARLQTALATRSRAPRRVFLEGLLADVATGSSSVLEQLYLERVVRPHALPTGLRQAKARTATGVVYRDVSLGEVLVELDGRLFHDTARQRDHDFERDLDAAVAGHGTVRLTWGQVVDRPCSTAAKLSHLLVRAGWPGGRPCGAGCPCWTAA